MTISSTRIRSPALNSRCKGISAICTSLPSVRRTRTTLSTSSIVAAVGTSSPAIRLASRLKDASSPVLASNTSTATGEVSTSVSIFVLARCSSRCLRALAMTSAAWEANITTTSSSSWVNSPPSPLGQVDGADPGAPVADRRHQQ